VRKIKRTRTIVNECADGAMVRLADPSDSTCEWTLEYRGLTDVELNGLFEFFESVEGRLQAFTFVDPTANLFLWTEELDRDAWIKDPFLQATGGAGDPRGGAAAWSLNNHGGASARIGQTINVPGPYEYCFSIYARGAAGGAIRMKRGALASVAPIGPEWKRLQMSGSSSSEDPATEFGIELEPGAAVEVFGPQLEAQPGATVYRRTTSRGGVYTGARFMDDRLRVETTGPNEHSCLLRVLAHAYNI
jgi:hypothetical protein